MKVSTKPPALATLAVLAALGPPCATHAAAADGWWQTRSGLDVRLLGAAPLHPEWPAGIHLVRLDPQAHALVVRAAADAPGAGLLVAELAAEAGVLAAINGGFFDASGRPIGWVVASGVELSPPARRGWAALRVDGQGRAAIVAAARARSEGVAQAIQAGPRLVVMGRVNALKAQVAVRSFAGLDAQGRLVLGTTAPLPASAAALASRLAAAEAEGGAGLVDVLNLDGGSSTQYFVRAGQADGRDLLLQGGVAVPNALVVVARAERAAPGGAGTRPQE